MRLVVDGTRAYEGFSPGDAKQSLFVEITPMTFPVLVKPGIPITQLRFFCGRPEASLVEAEHVSKFLVVGDSGLAGDGSLHADLTRTVVGGGDSGVAFRAKSEESMQPIPLWVEQDAPRPDPRGYWDLLPSEQSDRLVIQKGSFYILRSRERIHLPKGLAVYCRATDETIGEMRIHYAGFVHPFFGTDRKDGAEGTPLIFEIRGHDVDVNLADGEVLARLIFYRMSEDAAEDATEEDATELDQRTRARSYNDQTLELSKYFGPWKGQV